eukprot:3567076-Rhodomonas_salina.1
MAMQSVYSVRGSLGSESARSRALAAAAISPRWLVAGPPTLKLRRIKSLGRILPFQRLRSERPCTSPCCRPSRCAGLAVGGMAPTGCYRSRPGRTVCQDGRALSVQIQVNRYGTNTS